MNYTSSDNPSSKCSVCVLGQFCLPVGISSTDIAKIDTLVKERVHLQKGESLYRHGEPLIAVYSIRFGTLKTEYCLEDGRQQVIGFHLPGEILGLDGIGDGHYQSEAIALEESEVCIIRYEAFEDLAKQQGDWGMQGSRKHQIMRYAENAERNAVLEQKPAAWMDEYGDVLSASIVNGKGLRNIPLYAHSPQRPWVGLTDEEMQAVVDAQPLVSSINVYFKAIEAKLKEKNT
jgi:CRP-like cAMP-binding protein